MTSLVKTLAVVFLLFLLNGWMNSGQFRYLGDKTRCRVCYAAAEMIDRLHDTIDQAVDDVKQSALDRIERWDRKADGAGVTTGRLKGRSE
ncbi:MAG: hypothetical protein ABSC19_21260 [Syntrophorhabdales bacterium]|jgi:hypothetical protein